jgi:hypothetical protein
VIFLAQLKEKGSIKKKEREYKCSFCSDKFKTRLELMTHKREQHGIV